MTSFPPNLAGMFSGAQEDDPPPVSKRAPDAEILRLQDIWFRWRNRGAFDTGDIVRLDPLIWGPPDLPKSTNFYHGLALVIAIDHRAKPDQMGLRPEVVVVYNNQNDELRFARLDRRFLIWVDPKDHLPPDQT